MRRAKLKSDAATMRRCSTYVGKDYAATAAIYTCSSCNLITRTRFTHSSGLLFTNEAQRYHRRGILGHPLPGENKDSYRTDQHKECHVKVGNRLKRRLLREARAQSDAATVAAGGAVPKKNPTRKKKTTEKAAAAQAGSNGDSDSGSGGGKGNNRKGKGKRKAKAK